jgi:hypothetical protein
MRKSAVSNSQDWAPADGALTILEQFRYLIGCLDINPLIAGPADCVAADVLVAPCRAT